MCHDFFSDLVSRATGFCSSPLRFSWQAAQRLRWLWRIGLNGMPSQDRFAAERDRQVYLANAKRTSVIMPGV
ncbi:hypothetical protein HCN58_18705 [Bradyrhizobium sp. WSM 1791]|uniref:Uncharacterized protein n=1 Tax=Bradyrhizobium australiense TaxID=2721161 RepID=A0A7Y4GTR0_9BRAD|nr:hypothetical protein [Bradyrhizobium australiense]